MPRPKEIDEWLEECKAKGTDAAKEITKIIDEFESDIGCSVKDIDLKKIDVSAHDGVESHINNVRLILDFSD